MTDPIRWGILATGRIAGVFARGLADAGAELAAVGSRRQETADAFGDQFQVPRRHASYEALAADPEVDVVYVSSPHPMHCENTLLLLEHGKAVLCEKPFTINAAEARRAIVEARRRELFLMEAMWTRFIPAVARVRELIAEGAVGEPRMVQADFGFRAHLNPEGRLFNPDLGGGGLLDIGIYVLSLASMVFGPRPKDVASTAHLGETGVDEQAGMTLRWPGGELAVLSCAVRTSTPGEARIFGTEGSLLLHGPFFKCSTLTLKRGDEEERLEIPVEGNGYNYQALEVERCLREGRLESETMPLDESLALMELMDRLRAQWGLVYPTEV